jgi:hypothetical protein
MKISKLPSPLKELAEKRREEQKVDQTEDRLLNAFHWSLTPEDYMFWRKINCGNSSVIATISESS